MPYTTLEASAPALVPGLPPPLCTLADLYDPLAMPADLLKAHQRLDAAVDKAYRGKKFDTERERAEYLFAQYEKLTAQMEKANTAV